MNLVYFSALSLIDGGELITGFGKPEDKITEWKITNDGVMGGLSEGFYQIDDLTMKFYGTLSLENRGGFSSLAGSGEIIDLTGFEVRKKNRHF